MCGILVEPLSTHWGKRVFAELKDDPEADVDVYFGGDFVFEEQINEAALHDVMVMGAGLLMVGAFTWFHFNSFFLAAVVALQIVLSFSVTYTIYRVWLGIPKLPLIMLLG